MGGQVNDAVICGAQGCSEEEWRRTIPDERRSIAYLLDHIAWGYGVEAKASGTTWCATLRP